MSNVLHAGRAEDLSLRRVLVKEPTDKPTLSEAAGMINNKLNLTVIGGTYKVIVERLLPVSWDRLLVEECSSSSESDHLEDSRESNSDRRIRVCDFWASRRTSILLSKLVSPVEETVEVGASSLTDRRAFADLFKVVFFGAIGTVFRCVGAGDPNGDAVGTEAILASLEAAGRAPFDVALKMGRSGGGGVFSADDEVLGMFTSCIEDVGELILSPVEKGENPALCAAPLAGGGGSRLLHHKK